MSTEEHALLVEEGSLHPALRRLLKRGWFTKELLAVETTEWERLTPAIAGVPKPA
ncbi:MAG: hypothetical protein AB7F99_15815 [Vicinamibacterales bacterium]